MGKKHKKPSWKFLLWGAAVTHPIGSCSARSKYHLFIKNPLYMCTFLRTPDFGGFVASGVRSQFYWGGGGGRGGGWGGVTLKDG